VLSPWELDDFLRGRGRWVSRAMPDGEFRTQLCRIATSAASKAATFGALRLLIESGRLLIPAGAGELYRELLMLGVELTAGGSERIEARVGHDDLADALSLALGPYRDREGRWRTVIGDLADSGRALPQQAALARGSGELATTASGAAVPRRPLWQSIASCEVTAQGAEAERWARSAAAAERQEFTRRAIEQAATSWMDEDDREFHRQRREALADHEHQEVQR